ncbi:MAG: CHASE3 domain-containing protein [Bacteroidetes bacterium]|nr:CHASE3 domain-containing protein [Bacteroidota bacterium]
MATKILQKLLLPISIVIIATGSVGYSVYKSNAEMNDSEKWVHHTEHVLNLSKNILSATIDMESGVRGFELTKDSDFLAQTILSKKVINEDIEDLKVLTQDRISQQILLDSLEFYLEKRIASLDLATERIKTDGLTASITNLIIDGKKYSIAIRYFIDKIQANEYELLKERELVNEKSVVTFYRFLGAMFLLMLFLCVLFIISYYRNLLQTRDKILQADELIILNNDLKISESKYLKLNDDLEHLVIERTAKLELANKDLESFSYSVSHDLRSPIRAINGYTKILEEDYHDKFDEDGLSVLASIITNSKKMGQLIDDLLAFSKLGRKSISGSEINMQQMVTTLCQEISKENLARKIEFSIHQLTPIYGDPSLLHQVWINLINNSVNFSKYKPTTIIEIGCYQKDDQTVYFVKDHGSGFDMKYYDKLFGVFQRLHGQEEFEGTGIGLAIIQKIVTKHNGLVWGESILNEGASFYFSLPNEK